MMIVALIMRPWIIEMRQIPSTIAYILADDVMVLTAGPNMARGVADAIDGTHAYLHDLGAKVAPDKSYNFSSSNVVRSCLESTWWEGIQSKIEVNKDFRYLGAHITSSNKRNSKTLNARWDKALRQLKQLIYSC